MSDLVKVGANSKSTNTLRPASRLPKKRSKEYLRELKARMDGLPCWRPAPGQMEQYDGAGLWADSGKLGVLRRHHQHNPATLFRRVLKLLVTRTLLKADGWSISGRNETVRFPPVLIQKAMLYVVGVNRHVGGDPQKCMFDPCVATKHLLRSIKLPRQQRMDSDDGDD
ncbi:Zinc finger protein GLI2 [Frankliniella fusca]|uniref:Zinc finger protein GLI2 n=1 Tax=Frankliniella fusca TaxID=407009 RepID=A0AAE1H7F9_9NEOP|nr:Zinc finger protein GLI2 [Frankliniella fusca]